MWEIEFDKRAEKEFFALPRAAQDHIAAKIDSLADSFAPRGSKKLTDKGATYRLRVGGYRVIYEVNRQEGSILVTSVVKRGQAGLYD